MKIKKDDLARLFDTATRAQQWLTENGHAESPDFAKAMDLMARVKPHKRDSSAVAIRHGVIRKIQKRWFAGLLEFGSHAAVALTGDVRATQDLYEDVVEGYQFIEWFVIDGLNRDNLDEDDHREADEAFAEQEREYRESQKKKGR